MLVVGRTKELKIATEVNEANELLNEGWSLLDAKVASATEFVLLLGWFGCPRQEILETCEDVNHERRNG